MNKKYKVLIVDDESDVAEVIAKKVNWDSLGYEQPRFAGNGIEALEVAEEYVPDVVLTDIKMPFMDGLELSRRLKEENPNIRIIIFSGFDEFEFAKEAVHLEAEEYILKPVDISKLEEVFDRVKKNLDADNDARQNVEKLEKYYLDSLPQLQEAFFVALLQSNMSQDQIDKYLKDYHIYLTGPYYVASVIHINNSLNDMSPLLLTVAVEKLAKEKIDEKYRTMIFHYIGNLVVIAQFDDKNDVREWTDFMDSFCRLSKSACNATISVGVGNVVDKITDIPGSYAGARSAISYRVIYGRGKAINISEVSPSENDNISQGTNEELQYIFKEIKIEDDANLKEVVQNFIFGHMSKINNPQTYQLFIMDIVGELCRFCRNNQLDMQEVFGADNNFYENIQHMDQDDFAEWVWDVCDKMKSFIHQKRNDTSHSFVAKAKDYVEMHYSDQDLSIQTICSALGVSAAYFSTVFKKETGQTFINYLTEFRMNKAMELLIEHDEKTYVIAEKVGYSDPNYFSYVFRKQYGVSPSKYKSKKEN